MEQEREFIPLHVAIVDVSSGVDEVATVIAERLIIAGHEIVARERIDDDTGAVHARLTGWISDADVDVVFAISSTESSSTSEALAPLVTKPLKGFADLFRVIAYEEMKTAAMLVDVDAAQCQSTIVFVMPPSAPAVRTALEKIVVDQLDHRTKPTNLVTRLPRVRSAAPVKPIAEPKTQRLPLVIRKPAVPPPPPKSAPDPAPDIIEERLAGTSKQMAAVAEPSPASSDPGHAAKIIRMFEAPPPKRRPPTEPPPPPDTSRPIDAPLPGEEDVASPRAEIRHRARSRPAPTTILVNPMPLYVRRTNRLAIVLAVVAGASVVAASAVVAWSRFGPRPQAIAANDPARDAAATRATVVADAPPAPPPIDPPARPSDDIEVDPQAAAHPPDRTPPTTSPRTPGRRVAPPDAGAAPAATADAAAADPPAVPPEKAHPELYLPKPTPPQDPPPEDPCDEVTCVANGYDQPCCAKYKPADSGYKPRPAGLPDDLDRDMVKKGVAKVKAFVDQCGEKHPGVKGVVTLAVHVDADGHITEVSVAQAPDDGLGECVATAMKRATFGKSVHGGSFRYPYRF